MNNEISCIDRSVDILECGLIVICWTLLLERQMLGLCGLNLNNYMLEKLGITRCFW